mgnify:FL=1
MSKDFIDYYYKNKKNFTITKKDKNKCIFILKEGLFKFKVNLKNLTCSFCKTTKLCNLKKCNHIYQLFNIIYNVPVDLLEFLWKNNNSNRILNGEELKIYENDTECMICLDDIFKNCNYNKVTSCLLCGKYYHTKCLRRCKEFICLNCNNNWKNKIFF